MFSFEISPEKFESAISQDKPVAVDFFTSWCGSCKLLEPRLSKLSEDYGERAVVISIDAEKAPSIADKYKINSVPTIILFKNGQEMERLSGLVSYEQLSGGLNKLL